MDGQSTTAGERLRAWRLAQDPKRTLTDLAAEAGVKHPTWIDWESGARSPSLEKALAVELLTGGHITVEAWGHDGAVVVRAAAARTARISDDADDIATADTLPPTEAA